jgi:cyclopropane fatty-acyl-phospholipid synthase-like methyltransferase
MKDGGYDAGYQACACFWGTEPSSLVRKLAALLPSFNGLYVLDAGCGEGKNALFLARQGAHVHGFDVSDAAIAHAREIVSANAGNITFEVSDVRERFLPADSYDVVIAYGLLHCLASAIEVHSICQRLQTATRESGYFVLCAFNDRYQDLSAHPGFSPTALGHTDYLELFDGWEMLEASDSDLVEVHPHNGIRHTHSLTRILARKLGGCARSGGRDA